MSEISRKARRAARAKAHRLATQQTGKVDCSSYGGEEDLGTTTKTGMRPISRRAYKRGGKVEGEDAKHHAGRMPRKSGGAAKWADEYVNRNAKDANEDRAGARPNDEGGYKRGGRTKRDAGGEVPTTRFNIGAGESIPRKMAGFKKGGRTGKSVGGDIALGALSPAGLAIKELTDGKKRGGSVKHSDEKEDRALVKKMVKSKALTGKCEGGELDGEMQDTRPTGGRRARKSGGGNWIAGAIKHPGALHKELHVPEGKKIPAKKLAKAAHSDNPKLAKRARLAETLKRMHRKDGGEIYDPNEGAPFSIHHREYGKVGEAKTLAGARRAKDRRDNQYGAYVHNIKDSTGRSRLKEGGEVRTARKDGGRTKGGKTDINIIIGAKGPSPMGGAPMPGAPGSAPIPVPVGPPALGATGPALPGAPPPAAPPMGAPGMPLPRKRGGRTYASYKDMDAGAGSGEGRLEKTEIAKRKK